ncbi:uncharacterized protein FFUJ_03605 [Fusarium fujikuroi IMI 58289]|uniref:Uncharacterized protein n=1 Tax=Gibberella fujikuroi (strain CBS 195.34 / IMI 58289 / NRRL A-6831) TaxID=1279085 RepID=S0DW99_GIBF5|nr:LOW QUALITY PROTEIN: uncharacterized protein FFUJ_03605 [Fusarium fujikuroi IMI 58289]CCT66781.1 uncharacterized protein FFUJ_03605 [Fusarium fujikuroi IMI 58289]
MTSGQEQVMEEAIPDLSLERTIVQLTLMRWSSQSRTHDGLLNEKERLSTISRPEGVFRWADLQIRALTGQIQDRDIRRALSRLPQGLEVTYERLLKKIDNGDKFEEAYAIFRWLAFSTTQLNLTAMSELAAFETNDPECLPGSDEFPILFSTRNRFDDPTDLQNLLSDLVIIPDGDNPYRAFPSFAHSTVLKYLMNPRVSPAKFHLDRPDATWFILKGSWAYMVRYDSSPQRSKFKPYPLLGYGCYQVWECALELVQGSIALSSRIAKHLTSTSAEELSSNGTASKFSIWWFCHRMELPGEFLAMTLLELLDSTKLQHRMPSIGGYIYLITSIKNGRLLINAAGADVFKPYKNIIAGGENMTVLTELLEAGANVNGVGSSGNAAIHLAATHGHLDIVTFLTEQKGVHLDSPNGKGETPLLLAFMHSRTAVVALLLGLSGSDSHRADEGGRTPLSWAATRSNKVLFDLLHQDQNVDVNKNDCHGRTPLIWAAIAGQQVFIKSLLSDPRIEPDARDHLVRTAVSWAAFGGYYHPLQTLWLDNRVTKYPCDYEGRNLLSYVCDQGHESLARDLLLAADLDINRPDYYQRTPLIWARLQRYSQIERLLLDDPRVLELDPESTPALSTAGIQLPDEYIWDRPMTPLACTKVTGKGDASASFPSNGMSISRKSTVDGVGSEIWTLEFSPDGRPKVSLQGYVWGVPNAAWGPKSSKLLPCCRDGYLRLWDFEFCRSFPDGKRLAAIDNNHALHIYTTDDQNLQLKIQLPSRASSHAVSKDSKNVLVRLASGEILLVNSASGLFHALSSGGSPGDFVIGCRFGGDDESLVLTGGDDGYIFIWDRETGNLVSRVKAHSALCNDIVVHPLCSSLFASCSDDGTFALHVLFIVSFASGIVL